MYTNEKEEDNKSMFHKLPAPTMCMIVAVILFILGGLVVILWKMVPKSTSGGGRKIAKRWRAMGGNCGCSMPQ